MKEYSTSNLYVEKSFFNITCLRHVFRDAFDYVRVKHNKLRLLFLKGNIPGNFFLLIRDQN